MPNHVTNELLAAPHVLAALKSDAELVDFNTVIPMPEILRAFAPNRFAVGWGEVVMGLVSLAPGPPPWSGSPAISAPVDAFRAGDYGVAADAMHKSCLAKMVVEGPYLRTCDEEQFEDFVHCCRAVRAHGVTSWYGWCCEHWGTKWNAYEAVEISGGVRFQTAWSTPKPVITALARKFPEELITIRWADEDFGYNVGWAEVKGEVVRHCDPVGGSAEARQLATEILGP